MKDGRRKGNAAENEVCRHLSEWVAPHERPWSEAPVEACIFRRQSTSIMPLTGHWKGKGDILHRPDVQFPFAVEVKFVQGWSLDGLYSPDWIVWKWWGQAKYQAVESDLLPLLLFRKNRYPWMAMVTQEVATCLALNLPVVSVELPGEDVVVVPLAVLTKTSDRLASVSRSAAKSTRKRWRKR